MTLDKIQSALLASYARHGGINHFDGINLPSDESVNHLAADFMHLLFPGFFEQRPLAKAEIPAHTGARLAGLATRLEAEIGKALRFARDPAARSVEEIILAYPCVLAISLQRIAHQLYRLGVPLLPRMFTEYAHERTGTDIHPGAQIGPHFFIDHCTGVVIGESARLGRHVKIYQGVTLGAKSFETDDDGNPVKGVKRHPDIGDHVTIYAHATILGGDTVIGSHSIIGANVWLMESIPANSIAYYRNENLVVRSRRRSEEAVESRTLADFQAWDPMI
jgi:serine O-acetyltransferase